MNETTYVYIVHSDINENNIYAEFATEAEAIEYAKRHIDELTYVDRVEALVDDEGDIIEIFNGQTIWIYTDEGKEDIAETEDEYWNRIAQEETDRLDAEGLLGDTTWFEDLDTDSLVETLEENEDIVECKECFELFPKADCVKLEVGYLCPHCHGVHYEDRECLEDDPVIFFDVADEDTFKLDFPELDRMDYGNDMIPDESNPEPMPEVGPNPDPMAEPCVGPECEAPVEVPVTKDETITKLVVDEHEAIDGYDKAKIEIETNSELDEKEKKEILDTIEHIKEEEIEHIEELEELVDEVEESEADEPNNESEVLVEGNGFLWWKVKLDDYFKKDGKRNLENKNGTGYWVDLIDPDTKESIIKPEDKKTVQQLKEAEKLATLLSKAEKGWAVIRVENAQGWNGILEVYEKGKCTKDITQKKLDALNKAWDEQETAKKFRKKFDKRKGKVDKDSETIDLPGENDHNSDEDQTNPNGDNDQEEQDQTNPNGDNDQEEQEQSTQDQDTSEVVPGSEETNTTVNAAVVQATKEYKKIIAVLKELGIKDSELEKFIKGNKPTAKLRKLRKILYKVTESLEEHVNEEHLAIESDQELVGTDNAVVDCKVNKVITHSEDEKPVDCEGKKKPLEKPLTESLDEDKLQTMEKYLKSKKWASLEDSWTEEGESYVNEMGAYLDYNHMTNQFVLAISIYHASDDNNADDPDRHTEEEEYGFDSLNEMYEDEYCAACLDKIYDANEHKLYIFLTEATHAQVAKPEGSRTLAYNNALTYAKKANKPYIYGYTNHTGKFFALDLPLKVTGRPVDAEKEFRSKYKNSRVIYMAYPDKDFITESKFTKAEQEEYNMDENGISLNSYDEFVRCGWCGEIFTKAECVFEKDFGWLCDRCQDELRYHGGHLDIITDPTEEDIERAENNK